MRHIYHFLLPAAWDAQATGPIRAASLDTEGFIHCSNRDQLTWVAHKFYAQEPELVVLCIDPEQLTSPLRDEDPGNGQLFPHIYGPIDRAAIVGVERVKRGTNGRWTFALEAPK